MPTFQINLELALNFAVFHYHQQHQIVNLLRVQYLVPGYGEVLTCLFSFACHPQLQGTKVQGQETMTVSVHGQHDARWQERQTDQKRSSQLLSGLSDSGNLSLSL